jgi:gluconate 5-dehydrogenase
MEAFSLAGEIALITGGGSGLGLAIARCFVQAGAKVVIVGRRESVLQAAVLQLGAAAAYRVHDITQLNRAAALVDDIASAVGPISILVNNAGIHLKKPVEQTSAAEFQSVLDAHVLGAFELSRAVIPGMKQAQHGSILFMASMTALIGQPLVVAYAAAKSAYLGMMRTLASELAPAGIRVNAIAPGWIESDTLKQAMHNAPERQQKILARTPMGRFGKPDDIGWAAAYLCSPAAQFITGVVLPVDGGALIGF